jgi:hypothetical protein
MFPELDKYYQNVVRFTRVRVPLIIPYYKSTKAGDNTRLVTKKERYLGIKAYMYVGSPTYWERRLDLGFEYVPVNTFTTRLHGVDTLYSQFTVNELPIKPKTFYDQVDNNELYKMFLEEVSEARKQSNSK